jgi:micrococcal nuclease
VIKWGVIRPTKIPLFLALVLLVAAGVAMGAETVRVAAVQDGDTIGVGDSRIVRLAGIEAPKAASRCAGSAALAEAATEALAALVAERMVELRAASDRPDRHGRIAAQLWRDDGLWAQGEMLRRGLARVRTTATERDLAAEMLALEAEARAARRGLWGNACFAVRDADAVGALLDSYQVVEGSVVTATKVHGDFFLNFGPDWRTDFTIFVPAKAARLFRAAKLDLLGLAARRVRIRGWIFLRNGPMIEATHPEQLEILPEP